MNRIEIKEKAKEIVKEKWKSFWGGYLVILAISLLCGVAIEILFNKNSIMYSVLTLVVSFFTMTLTVGFYSFVLKMVRGEEYSREDIFKYIGAVLPIATISILVFLFTFLWSILLIIPGIIAALGYTMAYLIYVDSEEMLPMEYLNKSKEMMRGYKWNYFVFNLSFIGWIIFSVITLGLGLIFVIPYVTVANTLYYDELKKLREKE